MELTAIPKRKRSQVQVTESTTVCWAPSGKRNTHLDTVRLFMDKRSCGRMNLALSSVLSMSLSRDRKHPQRPLKMGNALGLVDAKSKKPSTNREDGVTAAIWKVLTPEQIHSLVENWHTPCQSLNFDEDFRGAAAVRSPQIGLNMADHVAKVFVQMIKNLGTTKLGTS